MKVAMFKLPSPLRASIPMLSILGLAALFLAACHRPPAVVTAPVETEAPKSKYEASNEIPHDIYPQMPIYPGSIVQHVLKPRGVMREVVFVVKNPPPVTQMVDFFKEGLKKGNFKITSALIMPARRTWSCDFHLEGRPGNLTMYPDDDDKTALDIDLIYEMPSKIDQSLLEPTEDWDVVGPGEVARKASN